jgi:hypothetical protein
LEEKAMNQNLDREHTNETEWHNPDNWHDHKVLGLTFGGFYGSRADSRLWVPKRNPKTGKTLNLDHPLMRRRGSWL